MTFVVKCLLDFVTIPFRYFYVELNNVLNFLVTLIVSDLLTEFLFFFMVAIVGHIYKWITIIPFKILLWAAIYLQRRGCLCLKHF